MKNNKKYLLSCASAIAFFAAGSSITTLAATQTDTMTVSATTAAPACTLGAITDLTFPEIDIHGTGNIEATSDIKVTCNNSQAYSIVMDRGLNSAHADKDAADTAETNAMVTSGGAGPVAYFLSTTNSIATPSEFWKTAQNFTGTGAEQTHIVYGIIQQSGYTTGNVVTGSSISDTVTITLTF